MRFERDPEEQKAIDEWLKNNDVPYDEIYFNKPWGFGELNYIDDKFLSIEKFTSK